MKKYVKTKLHEKQISIVDMNNVIITFGHKRTLLN